MGNKSEQKKKYIIEKAREVFSRNGYRKVTMKDIVEACEISRGGLYLYFPDTKSLFEEVLKEVEDDKEILERVKSKDLTPGEALFVYLEEQKKAILKKDSLAVATYEYLFEQKALGNDLEMKRTREEAVKSIEELIMEGVAQEWMVCDKPAIAARNIAYILDGLRTTSRTMSITEEQIDQEIEYILGTLGLVVE